MWLLNKFTDRADLDLIQKEWNKVYYLYAQSFDQTEKATIEKINNFNIQLAVFNDKFSNQYSELMNKIYNDLSGFATWQLEHERYKHSFTLEYEHIEKIPAPFFDKKINFSRDENRKKFIQLKNRLDEMKNDYAESITFVKRQSRYINAMTQVMGLCDDLLEKLSQRYTNYIAPELDAVMALLYANSLIGKIANQAYPSPITPAKITGLKSGKYDRHYNFVHDVYRMYCLTHTFLTEFDLSDYNKNEQFLDNKVEILNHRAFEINEISKRLKNDIVLSR